MTFVACVRTDWLKLVSINWVTIIRFHYFRYFAPLTSHRQTRLQLWIRMECPPQSMGPWDGSHHRDICFQRNYLLFSSTVRETLANACNCTNLLCTVCKTGVKHASVYIVLFCSSRSFVSIYGSVDDDFIMRNQIIGWEPRIGSTIT